MTTQLSDPETNRAALHAARSARLREQLTRAPFDALLLTGPNAVDYATGFRSVPGQIHRGYPLAAVVTAERTVLVAPAADCAAAVDGGIAVDDIVPFGRFFFAGDGALSRISDRNTGIGEGVAAALRRVSAGRLGVEGFADLPGTAARDLDAAIGNRIAAGEPADAWMWKLRSVKLPIEQDLLRRAARLAEDGILAGIAAVGAGVTERDLSAAVASAMVAGGGDPRFIVAAVGRRSALADAFPGDETCRTGDLVRFDVGCQVEGYWSDIARTVVLGEASDTQRRRYDALLAGLHAELDLAAPCVTAAALFAAAARTVEEHGLSPYRRHHAGHAIGLSVYEDPVIRGDDDTVLEPGMVFCFETPYYEIGWGGMMVEDTGVVTDGGFQLFTGLDRALKVIAL